MKNERPARFITATSLFDGHDASINIIRRELVYAGAEVIHLAHNRSAEEIISAAIDEDADAVAISSYQGGHIEFFKYLVDLARKSGRSDLKIFGGGGGVIIPAEIKELEQYGVTKIFSPEDGMKLGLDGMAEFMIKKAKERALQSDTAKLIETIEKRGSLARLLSILENNIDSQANPDEIIRSLPACSKKIPVVGITGTGGAGKSSFIDEILSRLAEDSSLKIAVLAVDPSRRKTGGALLGDRIRINSLAHNSDRIFFRSVATRMNNLAISPAIKYGIEILKRAGFDLIIVETSGIGQADTEIVDLVDYSIYLMTSEYGTPLQLEKIGMLDYADAIVINKFEKTGSEDTLLAVRKVVSRRFKRQRLEELPVYPTISSQFNDLGVNRFYHHFLGYINGFGHNIKSDRKEGHPVADPIIPSHRRDYLHRIVEVTKNYIENSAEQAEKASELYKIEGLIDRIENREELERLRNQNLSELEAENRKLIEEFDDLVKRYQQPQYSYFVRGNEIKTELFSKTLAGTAVPKIAVPQFRDWGDILFWRKIENFPGMFPYTAGVFPFKRTATEMPTRMFAGEGTPERTNRRFHLLAKAQPAKRLSVAFDSVSLYGEDPDLRPDIYGKIGNSGVSIATLDDMKRLFEGFDLTDPMTSVSMTINGPAPVMLAMFFNTAIDQNIEKFKLQNGREPNEQERSEIAEQTLRTVRGTVQADILKEDQAQNTCLFSTDFSLRLMTDIQEYFIKHDVRNYYSVSISGYHIAEAGANPITQLALTLANGFTYVESYIARGMSVDKFARNLSFFFSNGMDAEYSVIGRVARFIWAVAMKYYYGASERSQKLKYHIQTSGRSLHEQEIQFNDIRTTLQALLGIADNCNSLHTNAYDEAITTPTEESVRRALAIQLIINKEFGMMKNENPNSGSFIINKLFFDVLYATLKEFEAINQRGGVLGAMETGYQRAKIQGESLYYEEKKQSGELPITGVNYFLSDKPVSVPNELIRSTEQEKQSCLENLKIFKQAHKDESPVALKRLKNVILNGKNSFEELMRTVRVASLGEITHTLFEVGGSYRRNM